YGYPQQPPAAASAAYGFPPAGSAPDPDFRLPPQGPQFIGR
ncbi:TerD family protein, partial [Streptomyces sp. SID9913]|nr:TerD family protein [Streptomyces sp. SID9913]